MIGGSADFQNWSPSFGDYFLIFHMVVIHATPLIMTWVNIYFTDVKIMAADWKLMAFHGFFYIFANYLGFFDTEIIMMTSESSEVRKSLGKGMEAYLKA